MKAAVYHGVQDIRTEMVDDPEITAPHELIVRVRATSICGSDLHIYRGALDGIMQPGHSRTGHELVGEVVETGSDVGRFRPGDRITMAYSCSCGTCPMCELGQTAHCETTNKAVYGFGDAFGDMNGTHAELMCIPHADAHAIQVPRSVDDKGAITLSCNLPTAIIANTMAGIREGETAALIGCGPTGLMCLDLAMARRPKRLAAFDPCMERRYLAERKGAVALDANADSAVEHALDLTGGRGFDKVIEVVGTPESLNLALSLTRAGGTISAVGVFTSDTFNLNLADVFLRDISLHMNGFANVQPVMNAGLELLERGEIAVDDLFTHEFELTEIGHAFRMFNDKSDGACKVLIRP